MSLNITKGEWFVRVRESGGIVVDCFVAAKNANGFAYDSEILGDDEYGHVDGDIDRKIADANLIAEAGTVANECGLTPRQLLEQRDELLEVVKRFASYGDVFAYIPSRGNPYVKAIDLIAKVEGVSK